MLPGTGRRIGKPIVGPDGAPVLWTLDATKDLAFGPLEMRPGEFYALSPGRFWDYLSRKAKYQEKLSAAAPRQAHAAAPPGAMTHGSFKDMMRERGHRVH